MQHLFYFIAHETTAISAQMNKRLDGYTYLFFTYGLQKSTYKKVLAPMMEQIGTNLQQK